MREDLVAARAPRMPQPFSHDPHLWAPRRDEEIIMLEFIVHASVDSAVVPDRELSARLRAPKD